MNWLQEFWLRLRALVQKQKLDAQMDEEMRSHIEMQTQENVEAGMQSDEARYSAIHQFGRTESIKEDCRDERGLRWLETFVQDIRFGARQLRKTPGFTFVAVLTLGLGIGVNTAIFSMAVSALWRPLPLPESDRLVEIWENDPAHAYNVGTSGGEFLDWKANCRSFSDVVAISYESLNLDTSSDPEHVNGARVTENFFSTLKVLPAMGRFFTATEIAAGHDNLAVISDKFCKRHFGEKANAIGQTLRLNGEVYEIIGVAPAEVRAFAGGTSVWLPLVFSGAAIDARGYRTIGRLKQDVSPEQARNELATVAARIRADSPSIHSHLVIDLRQLSERFGDARGLFHALLAIVGIVLIIACANLAGLLSVRSVYRRGEIGVRAALGASRPRIIRQLLVETLVLSCLGGGAGVLFAKWGFDLILGLLPSDLAISLNGLSELSLDWTVICFVAALSLGCGLSFGLVPAIQSSRYSLASAVQGSRDVGGGYQTKRLAQIFLGAQVAICFACVSVIGTILLSVNRFLEANPGFDSNNLLTFRLTLAGPDFAFDRQRVAFLERLNEQLRALPSVQFVASADILPFAGMNTGQINVEGEPSRGGQDPRPLVARVSSEYFATMKESLLRGRTFTRTDDNRGIPVAVINENLARNLFGKKGDPIGRRIVLRGHPDPFEIIGIVRNVHHAMLFPGKPLTTKLYLSQLQDCPQDVSVVIRTEAKNRTNASAIRGVVSQLKRGLPVFDFKTMSERIAEDQQMIRYGASCLALFASLAVLMTIIGVHGTIGHAMAQRTREFGVRLALGSTGSQLVLLVTQQGMRPITAGLLLGALGSAGVHAVMRSSLVGVTPPAAPVFAGISAALIGSMGLACFITALRVRATNPVDALRYE